MKFNTSMLRSNVYDYSDAITDPNTEVARCGRAVKDTNKKVIFKNCASLNNCISELNNT